MKSILLSFVVLFSFSSGNIEVQAQKSKRSNPMAPIKTVQGLPHVLIIGDSISIGYTLPTRALLQGKVNLHRIPTNGGPTTKGLAEIGKMAWQQEMGLDSF